MSDRSPTDVAPAWIWLATVVCGVLAAGVHVAGSVAYESVTGVLTGATVAGVVYLLYRWGQIREKKPSQKSEKEMEAEAGGYGGNGGGM